MGANIKFVSIFRMLTREPQKPVIPTKDELEARLMKNFGEDNMIRQLWPVMIVSALLGILIAYAIYTK